ncbi:hypothetical protein H312_00614 [Anncaliia algerae PRA339]|uniref:Retrotransposon gag domain-containing protein n=1 Tax=Anncaliia algerae PRA339 TaxID=1288291 RepID=A0A059F4S9_9MICR|nr:hypothetical protein H312_00614 [Anncaliia algerae PRA339]
MNSTCDSSVTFQRSLDKYNTSTTTPSHSTTNSITVEYTLLNTDLTLKRTIFPLNSLHFDLFNWVSHFRETVKLCRWEETTAVEVLKSLLPLDLLQATQQRKTCDTILEELLRMKYPERDSYFYQEKLNKLKQKNHIFINDYYNQITETVKRIAITQNLSEKEQTRKINETFMHGLDQECRLKFIEEGVSSIQTILQRINEAENFIIQLSSKSKTNEEPKTRTSQHSKATKFCRYHRTSTHSNEECIAQKKQIPKLFQTKETRK